MLKVKDVCAGYDGNEVLHQVNLDVKLGQITVLAGPNGCGKSTLLKTIMGMLPKTSGEILVDGKVAESYTPGKLAQKAAYLPQNRNVPEITVKRMVLHGRFPYLSYPRRYSKKDMELTMDALCQVEMEQFAEKKMNQLSGGMQQKVYLAMALAQDTPIIMMDEPTAFLDISYQIKLMDIARDLANQGKAVVMVLHDVSMALRAADQLVVMSKGKIVKSGSPEVVYQSKVLNQVFDLEVKRVKTEDGWQYYY